MHDQKSQYFLGQSDSISRTNDSISRNALLHRLSTVAGEHVAPLNRIDIFGSDQRILRQFEPALQDDLDRILQPVVLGQRMIDRFLILRWLQTTLDDGNPGDPILREASSRSALR